MKTIKDLDLDGKRVIVRVDYNVSVDNGKIINTKKIDDSFETIDYLVGKGCKIILLSHFGRVKSEADKATNSLKVVYEYIKSLEKYDILFSEEPMGQSLEGIVGNLKSGQIVLAENTRFLDLKGNLESGCDIQLAAYWASLADIYIDDAFASMHRNHASVTGIPRFIPSAIGFLVLKEIDGLNKVVNNPINPFVVVMGGAKLDDKINLIYGLVEEADYLLLGGGIANTFLKSLGYNVGASLVSDEMVEKAKDILLEYKDKILLPNDVITSPSYSETEYVQKSIDDILDDDVIGDIGFETVESYRKVIDEAKTIFVNGTVGMYEKKEFSNGSVEILDAVAQSDAYKVVGGGDAISALKKFGKEEGIDFISTGGGATLNYIEKKELVGLDAINNSKA